METVFFCIFGGVIYITSLFGVFYVFLKPDFTNFHSLSLAEREPLYAITGAVCFLSLMTCVVLCVFYLPWWGLILSLVPISAAYYPIRCLVRFRFMQKMKRLNL